MIAATRQDYSFYDTIIEQTGNLPLLSFEDEQALFQEIQNLRDGIVATDECQELIRDYELEDPRRSSGFHYSALANLIKNEKGRVRPELSEQAQRLIDLYEKVFNHNVRLIISIARKFKARGSLDQSDIFQAGYLGIQRATDKFEWERGFKFSTYATWWIRQSIHRLVADKSRTVRLPVHIQDQHRKIRNAIDILRSKGNLQPSYEDIAEQCKLEPKTVEETLDRVKSIYSGDTPVGYDEENTMIKLFDDQNAVNPMQGAINFENKERIASLLDGLRDIEKQIIEYRYGLVNGSVNALSDGESFDDDFRKRSPQTEDEHAMTLEEVGDVLGITRERVRQIEAKAMNKLENRAALLTMIDVFYLPEFEAWFRSFYDLPDDALDQNDISNDSILSNLDRTEQSVSVCLLFLRSEFTPREIMNTLNITGIKYLLADGIYSHKDRLKTIEIENDVVIEWTGHKSEASLAKHRNLIRRALAEHFFADLEYEHPLERSYNRVLERLKAMNDEELDEKIELSSVDQDNPNTVNASRQGSQPATHASSNGFEPANENGRDAVEATSSPPNDVEELDQEVVEFTTAFEANSILNTADIVIDKESTQLNDTKVVMGERSTQDSLPDKSETFSRSDRKPTPPLGISDDVRDVLLSDQFKEWIYGKFGSRATKSAHVIHLVLTTDKAPVEIRDIADLGKNPVMQVIRNGFLGKRGVPEALVVKGKASYDDTHRPEIREFLVSKYNREMSQTCETKNEPAPTPVHHDPLESYGHINDAENTEDSNADSKLSSGFNGTVTNVTPLPELEISLEPNELETLASPNFQTWLSELFENPQSMGARAAVAVITTQCGLKQIRQDIGMSHSYRGLIRNAMDQIEFLDTAHYAQGTAGYNDDNRAAIQKAFITQYTTQPRLEPVEASVVDSVAPPPPKTTPSKAPKKKDKFEKRMEMIRETMETASALIKEFKDKAVDGLSIHDKDVTLSFKFDPEFEEIRGIQITLDTREL